MASASTRSTWCVLVQLHSRSLAFDRLAPPLPRRPSSFPPPLLPLLRLLLRLLLERLADTRSTPLQYSKYLDFPDAKVVAPDTPWQPAGHYFSNGPRLREFLREMRKEAFSKYECVDPLHPSLAPPPPPPPLSFLLSLPPSLLSPLPSPSFSTSPPSLQQLVGVERSADLLPPTRAAALPSASARTRRRSTRSSSTSAPTARRSTALSSST